MKNVTRFKGFETTIFRICLNNGTKSVYPFLELPVICGKGYTIATSAAVGHYTIKNVAESTLIIAFSKASSDTSDKPDPMNGTHVCSFKLNKIDEEFDFMQNNCDEDERSVPDWMFGPFKKCQNSSENTICGNIDGIAIESKNSNFHNDDMTLKQNFSGSLITSIITSTFDNSLQILLSTNDGRLLQFWQENTYGSPWKQKTRRQVEISVLRPDTVLDTTSKYVYALNSNKVLKFSLDICHDYTDCSRCVVNGKGLKCVWVNSTCVTPEPNLGHKRNSCPPLIDSITPLYGPVYGGTNLTVSGSNLGRWNANVTVKVCGKSCDVNKQFSNNRIIVCKLNAVNESDTCPVEVNVNDHGSKYNISGTSKSKEKFKYVEVTPSFKPVHGPESGGTKITITGLDLAVNDESDISVEIDNISCKILQKNETLCITGRLERMDNKSYKRENIVCSKLKITINGGTLTTKEEFCYMEDPTITDLGPLRSIESGGTKVTVTGTNLDIISKPKMEIVMSNRSYVEECKTNSVNGTSLVCKTPRTGEISDDKVDAHVNFQMDGVEKLNNFSKYNPNSSRIIISPDPELNSYAGKKRQSTIDQDVTISGSGLKHLGNDIQVQIGKLNCPVKHLSDTHIICHPNVTYQAEAVNQTHFNIKVTVGNLQVTIGTIEVEKTKDDENFLNATGINLWIIIGGISLSVFVVTVTALIVHCIVRSRGSSRDRDRNGFHEMSESVGDSQYVTISGVQLVKRGMNAETLMAIDESQLLINRDTLIIGEVIGAGNFGCVFEGYLNEEGEEPTKVAIKTLQEKDFGEFSLKDFVEEALMMKDFDHPNVLQLLGISLNKDSSPLVVLPFMGNGDLLSFVANEEKEISVDEIISFALDISRGMEYLSGLKIVHRDLAARNCMLDTNLHVKVADFGLTRDVYEKGYYHSDNKKTKLPIRWMALESIEKGTYSTKSDVWSLGVVIWELLTRGVTPYPGVEGWDLSRYMRAGRRLPKPWFCPDDMYELMLKCWDTNENNRPDFSIVTTELFQMAQVYEEVKPPSKTSEELKSPYAMVADALPDYKNIPSNIIIKTLVTIPQCYQYHDAIPEPPPTYFLLDSTSH